MRLISCEITGFGKIQEQVFQFSDGLNVFCRENGWGKTTFSVFLKAMFYGMEYSRKRALSERAHYMPWTGGVYGGNLTFETGGRRYRIERFFGKTDKDDSFALYDLETGRPSADYDENIGEELFQVDRNSFEKSIFIPQSALETEMTDSLNAKMGNLSAAKDDINNFDAAIGRIKEARLDYTRTSKVNTGKLEAAKQQLRQCDRRLEENEALNQGYERQQGILADRKRQLGELKTQKEELAAEILRQSRLEHSRGIYREKQQSLAAKRKEMEELDVFFASGIPPAEEMSRIEEDIQRQQLERMQLAKSRQQRPEENVRLRWEELFAEGTPAEEEIAAWQESAQRIQELRVEADRVKLPEPIRRQWEELRTFFSHKMPKTQELEEINDKISELTKLEGQILEIEGRCEQVRESISKQEERQEASGHLSQYVLAGILVAGLLVAGVTMHVFGETVVFLVMEILFFAAACSVAVICLLFFVKRRQADREGLRQLWESLQENEEQLQGKRRRQEELSAVCECFLSEFPRMSADNLPGMFGEIQKNLRLYEDLQKEDEKSRVQTAAVTDELADAQMQLYTRLQAYAKAYGCDLFQNGGERELLERVRQDAREYRAFCEVLAEEERLSEGIDVRQRAIEAFLEHYPLPQELSAEERIQRLQKEMARLEALEEQIAKTEAELDVCRRDLQEDAQTKTVEELQRLQNTLDERIARLTENIVEDKEHLAETGHQLEELEEIAGQRSNLGEQVAEFERKVELLSLTEQFLQKARERFLARYMEPLQSGLHRYLTMLQRISNADFDISGVQLDMDLSVRILCRGSSREKRYFSRGYQDMVALCARFALLDVLYRKERPMLILDDPFTNFDGEKAESAMELLRHLAKERQIIYYTCHKSRMPE